MKLTSWNANCKFRSKFNEVDAFGWDVLVIQECENPETSVDTTYTDWAQQFHWVGRLSHKGLGLFLRPGLEAEEIASNGKSNKSLTPANKSLKMFIPKAHSAVTISIRLVMFRLGAVSVVRVMLSIAS